MIQIWHHLEIAYLQSHEQNKILVLVQSAAANSSVGSCCSIKQAVSCTKLSIKLPKLADFKQI